VESPPTLARGTKAWAAEGPSNMSTQLPEERRRGRRIPLRFHVEVSGIGLDEIPYCDRAAAFDVSDRGCQIRLRREIKSGDTLTLRVARPTDPTADQDAPFLYQVAWAKATNGFWVAGLEALEPGNPWRIAFPMESLVRR
jgi:PilZ domain